MQQFLQKMYLSGWICVYFKENWAFAHYCFFSRLFLCVSHYWERECLDSRVRHSGWVLNINVGPAEELKKYIKVQIVFVQIEKIHFSKMQTELVHIVKSIFNVGQQKSSRNISKYKLYWFKLTNVIIQNANWTCPNCQKYFFVGPAAELKKYLEVQIVFFQMAKCISPYCKMYLDINF